MNYLEYLTGLYTILWKLYYIYQIHRTSCGGPTYQAKRFEERERDIDFVNVFQQNPNTFYTIFYTNLCTLVLLFLAHTLLSLAHTFTHNSRHYLFWKDNN